MSLAYDLFIWWKALPDGAGVTLTEMLNAVDANEPQAIRAALTRLRKGGLPDAGAPGERLPPLPVRFNFQDGRYYDLSRLSGEAVRAQVPGGIFGGAFAQLITRVGTLNSAMGTDGVVAAADLLRDNEVRELIAQMPIEEVHRVEDAVQEIGRARTLLALSQATGPAGQLPAPDKDASEED